MAMTTRKLTVVPAATLEEPSIDSTERSAEAVVVAAIPVVAVLLLSDVLGSDIEEVTVAVLLMVPDGALGDVFTESVKFVSA